MIQRGDGARLLLESPRSVRIRGEAVRKNLDRHIAAEPCIAGAIHLPHATRAEGDVNEIGAEPSTGS
jgi:hypothetical protein